jgi:hypothetical protein
MSARCVPRFCETGSAACVAYAYFFYWTHAALLFIQALSHLPPATPPAPPTPSGYFNCRSTMAINVRLCQKIYTLQKREAIICKKPKSYIYNDVLNSALLFYSVIFASPIHAEGW